MRIETRLGARLMELAESGTLKAGTGTKAIDEARQETETVRKCQETARLARQLAFLCELRSKAIVDASRAAANERIESVWRDLLATRQEHPDKAEADSATGKAGVRG